MLDLQWRVIGISGDVFFTDLIPILSTHRVTEIYLEISLSSVPNKALKGSMEMWTDGLYVHTDVIFSSGQISCQRWMLMFRRSIEHIVIKPNSSLLVNLNWFTFIKQPTSPLCVGRRCRPLRQWSRTVASKQMMPVVVTFSAIILQLHNAARDRRNSHKISGKSSLLDMHKSAISLQITL